MAYDFVFRQIKNSWIIDAAIMKVIIKSSFPKKDRKIKKKKKGPKPLKSEDIRNFIDLYIDKVNELPVDEEKGRRYTTLEHFNEALGIYAKKIRKAHDPKKTPAEILRLICNLLDEHQKIEYSELILEADERRYYIKINS